MEQRFLQKLNNETKNLVQEIENFASTEIQVRSTPMPSNQSASSPKSVTLVASEKGAMLLYRNEQDFKPQTVLHELLHLRRYWNDFVPQILPFKDPDGDKTKIANQIENTLEHLVIVPKEADYGFDPYSQYNKTARENWESYPWPAISEPWARRKNCLLVWLTTNFLVTDAAVKRSAEQCLEQEKLRVEASNFAEKIGRVVNSKEHCISTAIRFLRIPRHETTMAYLDIKNQKTLRKPVPRH